MADSEHRQVNDLNTVLLWFSFEENYEIWHHPRYLEPPAISNNFVLPLRVRDSGSLLYFVFRFTILNWKPLSLYMEVSRSWNPEIAAMYKTHSQSLNFRHQKLAL